MTRKPASRRRQVLTYPIVADNKYLMGVIQLLNKKSGDRFTRKDEESVAEIAKALGTGFPQSSQNLEEDSVKV